MNDTKWRFVAKVTMAVTLLICGWSTFSIYSFFMQPIYPNITYQETHHQKCQFSSCFRITHHHSPDTLETVRDYLKATGYTVNRDNEAIKGGINYLDLRLLGMGLIRIDFYKVIRISTRDDSNVLLAQIDRIAVGMQIGDDKTLISLSCRETVKVVLTCKW